MSQSQSNNVIPPDVLDRVAAKLAATFKFAYYEYEDIKQECWYWALKKQHLYNPKWAWYTFLYTICYRKCMNLWRDKFRKTTPSCKKCHRHYIGKSTKRCPNANSDSYCEKYLTWVHENRIKQRVCNPLELTNHEVASQQNPLDSIIIDESLALVREYLSADVFRIYQAWLDGQASPSDEQHLLNELKDLFDDDL